MSSNCNTSLSENSEIVVQISELEQYLLDDLGFDYVGSGSSRMVFERPEDDYIIKLPISPRTLSTNAEEYRAWIESDHDPRYAACKLFWYKDVPVIMMERVEPVFEPESSWGASDEYLMEWMDKIPTWSFVLESMQLGISQIDGRFCAFDYPDNVLYNETLIQSRLRRKNHLLVRFEELQKTK